MDQVTVPPIWGTDAPQSMPMPRDPDMPCVSFEGFCFTPDGMKVDVTETELEQSYFPTFRPSGAS